ncbi:MAG: hypothetical protein Q7J46_14345 [Pseudomonas sp.]|nr:hypothetical protein [Pseudomonas sp.]
MKTQAPQALRHPRDYAAAILAEPLRKRRAELLQLCPAHWRDQVREHVQSAFAKIAAYRQHQAGRAHLARERPPAAPRREATSSITHHKNSELDVGNKHLAGLRAVLGKGAA